MGRGTAVPHYWQSPQKNVNGIQIGAAVHGYRLAAILLPEFVRQVEMHRGELVAGLRGLRRYLNSIACEMNPWGLRRWALSWVARINHDAVRIALTNMYRPDDPFRQTVEDLDPEEITAYFRMLGRVSVETQPFAAVHRPLRARIHVRAPAFNGCHHRPNAPCSHRPVHPMCNSDHWRLALTAQNPTLVPGTHRVLKLTPGCSQRESRRMVSKPFAHLANK